MPALPDAGALAEDAQLPLGHWETTEGSKLCLTILPYGLVRFATEVPHYRNPARVFGQVTKATSSGDDDFRMTVEVTRIVAKEIGPCHRHWTDYDLFEAEILGERVTSPNVNGHKIPELGGGSSPEAPRTFSLHFDKARESLDLCTTASDPPHCRKLTRKKSPSDFSRERVNGECKVDDDCIVVPSGEQCDPCLCPNRPSLRSWPKKRSADDKTEDLSWEREPEHLCGKSVPRRDDCPPCPQIRAVCKNKVCVLPKGA